MKSNVPLQVIGFKFSLHTYEMYIIIPVLQMKELNGLQRV